ncbi:MAG: hypothetical protein HQ500_09105 [Flavobacteriales bacterium]|nr:hypothetical protein [Flavobacteriales bacterium]
MKVLVIDTIHEALVSMLRAGGMSCDVLNTEDRGRDQVLRRLSAYEGLVLRSGVAIDRAMIDANPQLKFIGRVGAGLEHIDVEYAEKKGIHVLSSPEGNRQAVAEHTIGSLLTLLNHIHTADREVRRGQWLRKENEGEELAGKTVAIIGFGNTGSAFAGVLKGFQVDVIAYDKYKEEWGDDGVEAVSMEAVFERAEVVSLHLPYNEETHHLVNAEWIGRFKHPIHLVNTSRGSIVHTHDLLEALNQEAVKGACLDVLEYETETLKMPPIKSLPEEARVLMAHPKVLLTPHIAGLSVQSYEKLSRVLAQKIIDFFMRA